MVAILLSSACVGVVFFLLGHFRLTSVIGFMPANVTAGFLSCIGYKVTKKAIEVACGHKIKWFKPKYLKRVVEEWHLILPALPIGILLYLLKRNHIGKPAYNFPACIFIPTIIFYTILLASGGTIDSAREQGWLFPATEKQMFYKLWEESWGNFGTGSVAWSELLGCLPILAVMLPITCLDNMLKLASTETALEVDLDYNREMKVGGLATIVNAFLGSPPAYGQTKFNVLNYGFTHSTDSRLASIVMASFCGFLFFAESACDACLPTVSLEHLGNMATKANCTAHSRGQFFPAPWTALPRKRLSLVPCSPS